MSNGNPGILVLGAGVAGLTTAVCLAEAGARVAVQAALPPAETTSAVAGAIWGPHLVGMDDRVGRWGLTTLERLYELAGPGTGIRLLSGRMVTGNEIAGEDMVAALDGVRPCGPQDLPGGFLSGWRYTVPIVAMPVYLDYLAGRLALAGGTLETGITHASPAEAVALTGARVVVNCTGANAHCFARDPGVVPVRGQAIVVANPGLTEFFVGTDRAGDQDGTGLIYIFPRGDTVVLGGTHDTGVWSREPDPATAARILDGCASIEPALRGARVVAHTAGLRPTRPQVRVEAEAISGGRTLIHNYGHGGAGVTLSWGCAADAAGLALAAPG